MSFNPSQPQCLLASGVAASITGSTVKTTMFSGTIKGGTMGRNDMLKFDGLWSNNNSANTKTFTININGGTVIFSVNFTTTLSEEKIVYFINRNSLSAQAATSLSTNGTYGSVGLSTYTVNTANDMAITWSIQLSNAADNATLERCSCEIWRNP